MAIWMSSTPRLHRLFSNPSPELGAHIDLERRAGNVMCPEDYPARRGHSKWLRRASRIFCAVDDMAASPVKRGKRPPDGQPRGEL